MDNLFLLLFFVSLICLIIGIFRPTIFSRFIKGEITRKKIIKLFGIVTIASFILFGVTTDTQQNNQSIQQPVKPTVENVEVIADDKNQNRTPTDVDKSPTPAKTFTPTQVKEINNKSVQPTSNETVSQKNAIRKAKSYLSFSGFSHDGLISQLEYEKFSHEDAVYGVDNSGANWNEQAAKKAKSYMDMSAFSRGGLIEQLKYEKFTQEQAEYGANMVGL